jgi:hypothetical protein
MEETRGFHWFGEADAEPGRADHARGGPNPSLPYGIRLHHRRGSITDAVREANRVRQQNHRLK